MPRINIELTDNTGAEYTGNEQVIFVPGPIEIKDGKADDNNCIYISASDYNDRLVDNFIFTNVDELMTQKKSKEDEIKDAKAEIKELEKQIANPADLEQLTAAQNKKADLETNVIPDAEKAVEDIEVQIAKAEEETISKEIQCLSIIETYLKNNYDVIYFGRKIDANSDLNFLKDKDTYNVKYLTTGIYHPIKAALTPEENAVDFNFEILNNLMTIAEARKDCMVIASVDYDTEKCAGMGITGDVLTDCIKAAAFKSGGTVSFKIGGVEKTLTISASTTLTTAGDIGKFATLIVPNEICSLTTLSKGTIKFTAPASFAYLVALGACMKKNQYWLPVANSARGSVESLGRPDLTITKYHMDQEIILDENAIAFNGIVKIRPYGNVIWGDRTLLKLTDSVKASGYTSLMLMVCDISKEAYNASVRYTYESNNEVTWLSYKSRITALLDQMVTAGVLQSYDVAKMPANTYNKIVCKITIYPNLPVENFDIYINLDNAELQLENA